MTSREVIKRFFEDPTVPVKNSTLSLFSYNGTLYSYGQHFWLARYKGADKQGCRYFEVNNGVYRHTQGMSVDNHCFRIRTGRTSTTTRKQQSLILSVLNRELRGKYWIDHVTENVGEAK